MPILTFQNSRIAGLTCTFPRNEVSTDSIAARFAADAKRILAMTGIEKRRIAPAHICASDLCADAGSRLLDALGWERGSVGALVFVTQTADYLIPASACLLQKRLGLSTDCACFDVNMGCSGYVYGLFIASSLIESGINRVLLLVGDTLNRMISEEDRSVAYLFGDGGSATALERAKSKSTFVLGTDGSGANQLMIRAGASRQRATPDHCVREEMEGANVRSAQELYMNGSEVMAFTLKEVPALFERLLAETSIKREDVDAVVMHQANQFLLDNLARKINIGRDRVPTSIRNFGNTSCASIPVTISTCLKDVLTTSTLRLVMMGFGVGWSWAACIGEYGPIIAPPINEID